MKRGFLLGIIFLSLIKLSSADPITMDTVDTSKYQKAVLAGGCFWCVESDLEKVAGVVQVVSGYTGGMGLNPTYHDYEEKGHIEAVEITYDPSKLNYTELLDVFWMKINPTDSGGQFCDRGAQYRPVIFYLNEKQKKLAQESKEKLARSGKFEKPVTTELIAASIFYPAEEYHQDYYKKNPARYKFYRFKCGRDQFLEKIWGKSSGH